MANEDYVRKTISLDPQVYDLAVTLARQRGFANSFSAYIAWLVQRDSEGGVTREHIPRHAQATTLRVAEDEPPPRKPKR